MNDYWAKSHEEWVAAVDRAESFDGLIPFLDDSLREHKEQMRIGLEEFRRNEAGRELAKFFMQATSRDGQKNAAAKRHENLAKRDDWLRAEFTKKCADDPNYSVEQFRKWLKRSRKFAKQLRPKGKLISVQRLRQIVDQVDPPKNS